jgi:hypothetical protein
MTQLISIPVEAGEESKPARLDVETDNQNHVFRFLLRTIPAQHFTMTLDHAAKLGAAIRKIAP